MVKLPTILLLVAEDTVVGQAVEPGVSHGTGEPPPPSGPPSLANIPSGACKTACTGAALGRCDQAILDDCFTPRGAPGVLCSGKIVAQLIGPS